MSCCEVSLFGKSANQPAPAEKKDSTLENLKHPFQFLSNNPKTVIAAAAIVATAAVVYFHGPALEQTFSRVMQNFSNASGSSFFANAEPISPELIADATPTPSVIASVAKKSLMIPTDGTSIHPPALDPTLFPIPSAVESIQSDMICQANGISIRPTLNSTLFPALPPVPQLTERNILLEVANKTDVKTVFISNKYIVGEYAWVRDQMSEFNKYLTEIEFKNPGAALERVKDLNYRFQDSKYWYKQGFDYSYISDDINGIDLSLEKLVKFSKQNTKIS